MGRKIFANAGEFFEKSGINHKENRETGKLPEKNLFKAFTPSVVKDLIQSDHFDIINWLFMTSFLSGILIVIT